MARHPTGASPFLLPELSLAGQNPNPPRSSIAPLALFVLYCHLSSIRSARSSPCEEKVMKTHLNYIVKTKIAITNLREVFQQLPGKTHDMGFVPIANAYPYKFSQKSARIFKTANI